MEEIGLPKLTSDQVAELCEIAERAAREYILSKIRRGRISTLNITVETEGTKPVTVNVDVDLDLSPKMKGYNTQKLANEATRQAFASVEDYLRKLTCQYMR